MIGIINPLLGPISKNPRSILVSEKVWTHLKWIKSSAEIMGSSWLLWWVPHQNGDRCQNADMAVFLTRNQNGINPVKVHDWPGILAVAASCVCVWQSFQGIDQINQ